MFEVRFRREALGFSLGRLKGRMFAYNFDFTAGMTKYNRSLAIFYLPGASLTHSSCDDASNGCQPHFDPTRHSTEVYKLRAAHCREAQQPLPAGGSLRSMGDKAL
jgi:hypothetical protein